MIYLYLLIVSAGLNYLTLWVLWGTIKELKQRRVVIEDLAETAAEISAKTHVSYDTAFQSLVTLTYTIPDKIRKRT